MTNETTSKRHAWRYALRNTSTGERVALCETLEGVAETYPRMVRSYGAVIDVEVLARCSWCGELAAEHHAMIYDSRGVWKHRDRENCGSLLRKDERR